VGSSTRDRRLVRGQAAGEEWLATLEREQKSRFFAARVAQRVYHYLKSGDASLTFILAFFFACLGSCRARALSARIIFIASPLASRKTVWCKRYRLYRRYLTSNCCFHETAA